MNGLKDPIGIEQIELMFSEDINFFVQKEVDERSFLQKLKMKHFFAIPSLFMKRIYRILPPIFKDIFFWAWVPHRAPASKFFARTRYAELRTLFDIKLSSLTLKSVPSKLLDSVKTTFDAGFYSSNISDISELDVFVSDVIHYANPNHAGARPYFKDGKNQKIEGSMSAYYDFSKEDNKKISSFILERLDKDYNFHLSALAGYKCKLKNISYSLGIVYGENSNSEMHQDTFASIAKGFIYLQDVSIDNSPFEYIEGSYKDASFRSSQTNKAVISNDTQNSGATRLRGKELDDAINRHKLKTFTGPKGLLILANTAAYHRKGSHNSSKPRITLNFEIKRRGLVSKFVINLLAIVKFKILKK